ncbi:MAG: 50S ribosomal protein L22 [Phycisphaerae bacterium]|nr:50S ribosomal protein L22 [Phycisphaerae bacterium]
MPWQSTQRFAKITARKARLITDMIKGYKATYALELLEFTHQRGARLVEKVLRTAMANADEQGRVDLDDLVVSGAWVNEGPTMKRWHPKDRGRAHPILKRTSHITVAVDVE